MHHIMTADTNKLYMDSHGVKIVNFHPIFSTYGKGEILHKETRSKHIK